MKRIWIAATIAVVLGSLLAGPPRSLHAESAVDFSSIAGVWSEHGLSITIGSDGQAVARWRIYTWCGDLTQLAPCDSMIGNSIENGGLAMLRITALSDGTATATVLMSSDASTFAAGETIHLHTLPGGVAQLDPSSTPGLLLCGPAFDRSAFATAPCGA